MDVDAESQRADVSARSVNDACFVCGSSGRDAHLRKAGYVYSRCRCCGMTSLDPLPSRDAACELYGAAYFKADVSGGYLDYEADEALHRENARRLLDELEEAQRTSRATPTSGAPPVKRLLDVGCALGFLCDEAHQRGWQCVGVEVSAWAAERVRSTFGFPVFSSLVELEREYPPESFDAVTALQVLEHMPRPDEALAVIHHLLRPGGRMLIETWDACSWPARVFGSSWQQVSPPSVVHLFGRKTLEQLLRAQGYELTELHTAAKAISVRFVSHLLAVKHPRLLGLVDRAVQATRLGELTLRYRLGDLVTVLVTRS